MNKTIDYLIIGQGIAGTLVAHELHERGLSFRVVDAAHQHAASAIAAGIINPITGRRFVKSWRIDELMVFAAKRYADIQQLLQCAPIYQAREILRVLFSIGEENEWLARTSQPGWKEYVGEANSLGEFSEAIFPGVGQGVLLGAQVNMPLLIKAYRSFLKKNNWLIEQEFAIADIDLKEKIFLDNQYKAIIFCEGAAARQNPIWQNIEFEPAKGEVFHLKIPGLKTERLLKHKMMLAPIEDDLFWFGANYEWNAEHEAPSEVGINFLTKRLDKMLKQYEIVGHFAATRPTIKDRRPVLGQHPELQGCHIFNGLGTKGASLGPLLAKEFVANLMDNEDLSPEINVQRFFRA